MRNLLRLCGAAAALALCLALPSTPIFKSSAAPALAGITVNGTSDAAADDGQCTLREAINSANSDAASGAASGECAAGSGADTITISVTGTINLAGALPNLASAMTIGGPGAGQLTVRRDTGGDYRIFNVNGGAAVHISGLTLTNGKTPDAVAGVNGGNADGGGGINNAGTLTLTGVTVSGNRTGAGAGTGIGGVGGGISNTGTLMLTGSTVSGNSTGAGGESGANGGSGGGIYNFGPLTLTDVVVSGNTAGAGGASGSGTGGRGGGIANEHASATLTRVRVTDNTAGACGPFGSGGPGGGIYFTGGGTSTLTDSTVSGNISGACATGSGTPGYAGGIENGTNLTVSGSTISGNTGLSAGAILNRSALSLTNTTVSGNNVYSFGSALNNDTSATMTLTNCTVAANSVSGVDSVSGVNNNGPAANAVVRNTLIAGNGGADDADTVGHFTSQGHNLVGVFSPGISSSGFNAPGDQTGTAGSPLNARLGPLADNGGPTLTTALLLGSPAVDAGDNALAKDAGNNALTTDQRGAGFPRIADAADADTTQTVDIGAFEAHPSVENIADRTTNEDTPLSFTFNVGDAALGISSVTASSGNAALFPNDSSHVSVTGSGSTRTLTLTPAANLSGLATITVTVTGTNGQSVSDTFQFTVTAVNDAPTLDALGDLTINEDAGTQTVNLSGISAGPLESQGLTVTATSSDTTLIPNPSVNYTSAADTGSISFAPAANKSGAATITVTVTDGGGTANGGVNTFSRTFNVTVNAVNDAPVNTVPGSQETVQHVPVVFSAANSNAVSVADIDAGTDAVKVTLTGTTGTVTLGSNAGLTFVTGDGTDDPVSSFTGTLTSVNAALNGLSFKPAQGFGGAASLQIATDDQGHNGSGGALTDTDSVTIDVAFGGTLQFSASAYEVNEDATSATITVTRPVGGAGAASVNYATSDGTATGGATCAAGVDYVSASGTFSWADGETADKTFTVNLCEDFGDTGDETVVLSLSGATGSATVGPPSTATLSIKDFNPTGGILQFSQNGYSVAEGVVALTVTVLRSGQAATAVAVDYATDDGSTPSVLVPCSSTTGAALDRCDFTKALGTLRFAAGETSKTFQVLISDDSYTEGSETAQLKLSNPTNGARLGPRAAAVMTITDDSTESPGNAIDDDTRFVVQHYHDFLNREPDAEGLKFWTDGITSCGADQGCREVKRIDTSAAFFLSIEFQETGYLVERTFKTAYGDTTSPNVAGTVPVVRLNEFLSDTQRIGRDVIVGPTGWEQKLEANKQAYAFEFVQRPRFLSAFPLSMTAAQFVDKLEQNAGITLTPLERVQLRSMLDATPDDTSKRAQVLRAVAEHQQLRQNESNRAFVLMQYFGYLRRNPDDAPEKDLNFGGWKFWLGKLEEFNGDYRRAEMVKAFLSSDEYQKRFGQ